MQCETIPSKMHPSAIRDKAWQHLQCNNGTIEMKLLQLQWNSYDCNRALHEANMRFIDRDYYTPGRIGIGGNSTGRLVLAFKLVLFCCKSEKIPLSM